MGICDARDGQQPLFQSLQGLIMHVHHNDEAFVVFQCCVLLATGGCAPKLAAAVIGWKAGTEKNNLKGSRSMCIKSIKRRVSFDLSSPSIRGITLITMI
jgi:hypothetical protein